MLSTCVSSGVIAVLLGGARRGDTEPQVANDAVANCGRNRCVDIVVLAPAMAP